MAATRRTRKPRRTPTPRLTREAAAIAETRLWAPWRARWIRGVAAEPGCLFCRVARSRADRRDLVLARRPHALLMLNRYPYQSAHLMVAVRRHVGTVSGLTAAERADWLDLVALAERILTDAYRPDGMNLGINVGRVAGAGFPGHLHLHVVPRWQGDTNFMPAIARTRVLPESLADTWRRLAVAVRRATPRRGHGAR